MQMVLHNITDEERRIYNCLHTLPEATISLIANLVEADPLPVSPVGCTQTYNLQLTDIQG